MRHVLSSQVSSYCLHHHRLIRRKTNLRYNYGLTLDQYAALMEKAGHACEMCGSPDKLVVDHCHKSNAVRGILCNDHNLMLGNATRTRSTLDS